MKKLIIIFAAAALLLSGCNNDPQDNVNNTNFSDTTSTAAENSVNTSEYSESTENTTSEEAPQETEKNPADDAPTTENNSLQQAPPDKTESEAPDKTEGQPAQGEENGTTPQDYIPDKTESTYQQLIETPSDDPFAEWYEMKLDITEYESFIEEIDRSNESEAMTEAEFEKFISDNAEIAWRLAGFCNGFGLDCFNITGQETDIDGVGYIEAAGPVKTEEEFWEYLGGRFSQRITQQFKSSEFFTEFTPLLMQDGKLYVASGAKGSLEYLDRSTIEKVYQSEDRIIISVSRDYGYDGGTEKKVFRSIVKEEGKWKFDFSDM